MQGALNLRAVAYNASSYSCTPLKYIKKNVYERGKGCSELEAVALTF